MHSDDCRAYFELESHVNFYDFSTLSPQHLQEEGVRNRLSIELADRRVVLGACPTLPFLLRRTICSHLRRSRPEKILNVFERIHLRFFRACGLAARRTSFASSRRAMSDRLPAADRRLQQKPSRLTDDTVEGNTCNARGRYEDSVGHPQQP
jgi:hypothetical protein